MEAKQPQMAAAIPQWMAFLRVETGPEPAFEFRQQAVSPTGVCLLPDSLLVQRKA
jgi:hypothetical protein